MFRNPETVQEAGCLALIYTPLFIYQIQLFWKIQEYHQSVMYMVCFCTLCSYATCEFYVNKDMFCSVLSNSLDSDLGPNCLQWLSADNTTVEGK